MPGQSLLTGRVAAVAFQVLRDLRASHATIWSAALAFYSVLSLFPLLLVGTVVASYVVDGTWVAERVSGVLTEFVPAGDVEVRGIVDGAVARRGRVGIVSLLVFMVTGRRVLGALTTALNLVSDVDERTDPLWRRVAIEVSLLVGLVALLWLALLTGETTDLGRSLAAAAPTPAGPTYALGRLVFQALVLIALFAVVYAAVPRGTRSWKAALIGGIAATVLLVAARWAFLLILDRLRTNLALVYGPVAMAALLLLWAWYVALITLVGGSIASHVKTMLIEGRSREETGRRHVPASAATADRGPSPA